MKELREEKKVNQRRKEMEDEQDHEEEKIKMLGRRRKMNRSLGRRCI